MSSLARPPRGDIHPNCRHTRLMVKKFQLSEEDRALFRGAVGKVRPLRHDRVAQHPPRPKPMPVHTRRDEAQVLRDMLSDEYLYAEVETGDELLYARPGLQHHVLRRLRRGQFSVHAELDLHGLTVLEARTALTTFLHHCQAERMGCVRIIHGKGLSSRHQLPVLKNKVNNWLRQRDEVLAFASARPVDGGTGALYVLIRRR